MNSFGIQLSWATVTTEHHLFLSICLAKHLPAKTFCFGTNFDVILCQQGYMGREAGMHYVILLIRKGNCRRTLCVYVGISTVWLLM